MGTTSTPYYYVKNLQGDIVAIARGGDGAILARYTYDAWGNILSITDNAGHDISNKPNEIANINPLRYRGYYYDSETGLYYLQSRFYDPTTGRFVNADSQLTASLGILGCNLFTYCLNNPVNKIDFTGNKPGDLFNTIDEAAIDAAEYLGQLTWENTWEYSTAIYSVSTTIKTYETAIKIHKFLWWSWTSKSKKTIKTKKIQYTYKTIITDKKNNSVDVPSAPLFKKWVAAVHTHPMGSWLGITKFSIADKDWADYYHIPLYVHGPNGKLRKYDPMTGEDSLVCSDLPISPKTPWLD